MIDVTLFNRKSGESLEDYLLSRRRITDDGCWEWSSSCGPDGYGQMSLGNRMARIHRVSYTLFVAPIPDGLSVCHRCDNPPCFRPSHLFLGTHADNMRDMALKGRSGARPRSHCPKGHEYARGNIYLDGNGDRLCKTCSNAASQAYYARTHQHPAPLCGARNHGNGHRKIADRPCTRPTKHESGRCHYHRSQS